MFVITFAYIDNALPCRESRAGNRLVLLIM